MFVFKKRKNDTDNERIEESVTSSSKKIKKTPSSSLFLSNASAYAQRKQLGMLTPWDRHFTRQCGRNSRYCRYCQPEESMYLEDSNLAVQLSVLSRSCHSSKEIEELRVQHLFQSELRTRHKLTAKHVEELWQLHRRSKMFATIRGKLAKRIQPADIPNDGRQTPYTKHAIDVLSHFFGVCCRSCLHQWYFVPWSRALSDRFIDELATFMTRIISECFLQSPEILATMMETVRDKFKVEPYYDAAVIKIQKSNLQDETSFPPWLLIDVKSHAKK